MTKVLIVEARFYDKISDLLLRGARAELDEAEIPYDVISVNGALEIPAVIRYAKDAYDGFVALGCVIKGDTYHFEVVANESARGIMDLAVNHGLAIGNGILTVTNESQAIMRAKKWDKGGHAARATIDLIEIRKKFIEPQLKRIAQ